MYRNLNFDVSLTFQLEERAPVSKEVSAVIESLKKKLAADRCISIKVSFGYFFINTFCVSVFDLLDIDDFTRKGLMKTRRICVALLKAL